jgi:hypothetical protein
MKILSTTLLLAAASGLLGAQDISPVLFGQNHWLAQGDENRTGYLHLLWSKVQASGVQLVRIGGNGYEVNPPSPHRWKAMVDEVQAIGAEPLVQVPRHASAEQAAELVRTLNAPGRKPVRYWSIGNEPMLGDKMKVEEVRAYVQRIAPAMRDVDPALFIMATDEAWMRQEAFEALCGGAQDISGKDASGRWFIDAFTFHSYPNGEKFERADVTGTGIQKIRDQIKGLLVLLEKADRKHGRTDKAKLRWAFTEFNVTYQNPDRDVEGIGNPSFLGGQFFAEVFGLCMEYGALTAAPWCINETDNPRTDFGYLGLPPDFSPRSAYYHEQMLARNFRGRYLSISSSQPLVKALGSRDGKRICVMVLNQELKASYPFELALHSQGSSSAPLVLKADAGLKVSLKGTLPPQTTQLFVFDAKGRLLEKTTYGVGENLRNLPPRVDKPGARP